MLLQKLWDSGIGLSAWLARTVCGKDPTTDASVTSTLTALLSKPPTKIIELGPIGLILDFYH